VLQAKERVASDDIKHQKRVGVGRQLQLELVGAWWCSVVPLLPPLNESYY